MVQSGMAESYIVESEPVEIDVVEIGMIETETAAIGKVRRSFTRAAR